MSVINSPDDQMCKQHWDLRVTNNLKMPFQIKLYSNIHNNTIEVTIIKPVSSDICFAFLGPGSAGISPRGAKLTTCTYSLPSNTYLHKSSIFNNMDRGIQWNRKKSLRNYGLLIYSYMKVYFLKEGEHLVSILPENSARQNEFGLDTKTSTFLLKAIIPGICYWGYMHSFQEPLKTTWVPMGPRGLSSACRSEALAALNSVFIFGPPMHLQFPLLSQGWLQWRKVCLPLVSGLVWWCGPGLGFTFYKKLYFHCFSLKPWHRKGDRSFVLFCLFLYYLTPLSFMTELKFDWLQDVSLMPRTSFEWINQKNNLTESWEISS